MWARSKREASVRLVLIKSIENIKQNLAPLYSAIGILEKWNDGILGDGKMESCTIPETHYYQKD